MSTNRFEIKEKLVLAGASKIFRNWNEYAGISEEEFIEGLRWLCADPMNGGITGDRLTRELGCACYGSERGLYRLTRCYAKNGEFAGFAREDGYRWNSGADRASISALDRI